jgi:hypothetical protein
MSGLDNIAREFDEVASSSPAWIAAMSAPSLTRHDLPDADHTFSSAKDRDRVAELALQWLTPTPLLEKCS